jgi:hypothetical protein
MVIKGRQRVLLRECTEDHNPFSGTNRDVFSVVIENLGVHVSSSFLYSEYEKR